FDAVAPPIEAGGLCPHIVGTLRLSRRRGRTLGGIEPALGDRPMVALVFVLRLAVGPLALLGVGDEVRADRRLFGVLTLSFRRRRHGDVLTNPAVVPVVDVVRVVIRNPVPPECGVIERQRGEVEPEPEPGPPPTPAAIVAAAPAVAATVPVTAVIPAVAAVSYRRVPTAAS